MSRFNARPLRRPVVCMAWVGAVMAGVAGEAAAQVPSQPITGIYTCIDSKGRRLTADRPITECLGKEQQVLNRDGSLRTVVPPTPTAAERAEKEARDRAEKEAKAAAAKAPAKK